jgi:hypothetical protein
MPHKGVKFDLRCSRALFEWVPLNYLKNLHAKISHLEAISCLSDFTKEVKRSTEERSSGRVFIWVTRAI